MQDNGVHNISKVFLKSKTNNLMCNLLKSQVVLTIHHFDRDKTIQNSINSEIWNTVKSSWGFK